MSWPSPEIVTAYADLIRALQWPLVAIILSSVFRNELRSLIRRVRKGKLFGSEFDLSEEIDALQTDVQASASEVTEIPEKLLTKKHGGNVRTNNDIRREVLEIAAISPSAAVWLISSEIEQYLRWLALNAEYQVRPPASIFLIADEMVRTGLMSESTRKSLRTFWNIRNKVAHARLDEDRDILNAVDSGLLLLEQIRRL